MSILCPILAVGVTTLPITLLSPITAKMPRKGIVGRDKGEKDSVRPRVSFQFKSKIERRNKSQAFSRETAVKRDGEHW
jgi:hypothetical protein